MLSWITVIPHWDQHRIKVLRRYMAVSACATMVTDGVFLGRAPLAVHTPLPTDCVDVICRVAKLSPVPSHKVAGSGALIPRLSRESRPWKT